MSEAGSGRWFSPNPDKAPGEDWPLPRVALEALAGGMLVLFHLDFATRLIGALCWKGNVGDAGCHLPFCPPMAPKRQMATSVPLFALFGRR